MNASKYQQDIFTFLHQNEALVRAGGRRKHLIVNALAGSGKSTTLKECIRIATTQYGLSCAYAMFTRDTVEDFKAKNAGEKWLDRVNTAHGFGNAALRRKFGRLILKKDKLKDLYYEMFNDEDDAKQHQLEMLMPYVCRLTTMAKDVGIGLFPDQPQDDARPYHAIISHHELLSDLPKGVNQENASNIVVQMAQALLRESNTITDQIDYSDMIYLALLYNCPFEKYDYVFIDEAQDTNNTRRELYKRMLKPWGSMIVVGDKHQAVFGFNGADVLSMTKFRDELSAQELPLSICYRCSVAVIEEAKKIVPNIEHRPDAEQGSINRLSYDKFTKSFSELKLTKDDVILCRFNAPNTEMAFRLIRSGIPCRIEGREIGYGIIKLADKLSEGYGDDPKQMSLLKTNVLAYMTQQVQKYTSAGREGKAQGIVDRCECLLEVIRRAQELGRGPSGVRQICKEMFQDSNSPEARRDLLTLSSIHKAKGREWHRVFILGRKDFMPSPWAKMDWEIQQEMNLIYVATTRAKVELVEINDIPKR